MLNIVIDEVPTTAGLLSIAGLVTLTVLLPVLGRYIVKTADPVDVVTEVVPDTIEPSAIVSVKPLEPVKVCKSSPSNAAVIVKAKLALGVEVLAVKVMV